MPEATLAAVRDHGRVRPDAVLENIEAAEAGRLILAEHGIDLEQVAARLLDEGLDAFAADLAKLLAAIESKLAAETPPRRRHTLRGPRSLEERIDERLDTAVRDDLVGRLWRRDHTLWKPTPSEISDRLGWLDLPETMADRLDEVRAFAHEVRADGYTHVVLMGMGGSSLSADTFRRTFGVAPGAPELTVLDTTHPAAITGLERTIDLDHTVFIAASKSGATIETLAHLDFYFSRLPRRPPVRGDHRPRLASRSRRPPARLPQAVPQPTDVGGRCSALSLFGLVPAALIGADLDELLETEPTMAAACHRCVPCERNPGLWLGLVAGEAARGGWDKLTLVLPPDSAALGMWVEQLVAESTGKDAPASSPSSTRISAHRTRTDRIACSWPSANTTASPIWRAPGHRSRASADASRSSSAPRSSGGSSPSPSPATSSA
jgi:transaldolase/glucose-6-phosphate isomerase